MSGSGRVWNFMTRTQPNPLLKFFFVTQPNLPSPKNRPNLVGWVGLGFDELTTHPYLHWRPMIIKINENYVVLSVLSYSNIKKNG